MTKIRGIKKQNKTEQTRVAMTFQGFDHDKVARTIKAEKIAELEQLAKERRTEFEECDKMVQDVLDDYNNSDIRNSGQVKEALRLIEKRHALENLSNFTAIQFMMENILYRKEQMGQDDTLSKDELYAFIKKILGME